MQNATTILHKIGPVVSVLQIFFCTVIVLMTVVVTTLAATDRLVCYHGSWANYRPGDCRYSIENINPGLCTEIVYAYLGLNGCNVRILDSWLDVELGALRRMTGLRSQNPNLKVLVAVGGWNEGSTSYSAMASNPTCRKTFTESAIKFMQTYGFDGIVLDWKYPAQRGGAATDKNNFSILLAEMRQAFGTRYILAAAVACAPASVDLSYDVPKLSQYLDQIHIIACDLHGAWDGSTGHNAPLYASSKDVTDTAKQLNIHACIQGWIKRGADPKKIFLGICTYGRSFTLADANKNGIGATSYNGGTAGRCTREASILGYNEICENIGKGGWTVVWDGEQQVPYAYKGNQWVGYDNARSITLKTEYAKYYGLGGIMVWSVVTDDFNGYCGEKDVLLKTIRNNLGLVTLSVNVTIISSDLFSKLWPMVEPIPPASDAGDNSGTTDGNNSGTTSGENSSTTGGYNGTTTSEDNSGSNGETTDVICTASGYARDPQTCTIFYLCIAYQDNYIEYPFNCPTGLYFDLSSNVCNWPALVPECANLATHSFCSNNLSS